MQVIRMNSGVAAVLLSMALAATTARAATATDVAATPDPCLEAVKAGSADADRVCSDVIAGLRYEGSAGRANPALPGALNNRAMARMKAGDLEGASADLTEAFELAPDAWAIHLNRANLALLTGNPTTALDSLARVRELTPAESAATQAADRNSVLAWRMLGNLNAAETQLATADRPVGAASRTADGIRSAAPVPAAPAPPPG